VKRVFSHLVLAVLGIVAAISLAACSPEQPVLETPGAVVGVQAMSPQDKRSQLTTDFPVEVPVPVGTVVSARSQGSVAWDYEMEVPGSPPTVRDWFGQAYQQRGWEILEAGQLTEGSPGLYLKMRKNAAQSRVDLVGVDGAPSTIVRVVVGVGAPVLETF